MLLRHPFFRSYGAILPSSLTWVLSRALGFSPHLPVSVCGTVTIATPYEDFLGSVATPLHRLSAARAVAQIDGRLDLPGRPLLATSTGTTLTPMALPSASPLR